MGDERFRLTDQGIIVPGKTFRLFDERLLGWEAALDVYEMIPRVEDRPVHAEGLPPLTLKVTSESQEPPDHEYLMWVEEMLRFKREPALYDNVPPERPERSCLGIELNTAQTKITIGSVLNNEPELFPLVEGLRIELVLDERKLRGRFSLVPLLPAGLFVNIENPIGVSKLRVDSFMQVFPRKEKEAVRIDYPLSEEEMDISAVILQV